MSDPSDQPPSRHGLFFGVAAYALWGVVPLYFRWVRQAPPLEILAHRVVWSTLFLACLLTLLGRWGEVRRCFQLPRLRWPLLLSSLLIAANWLVYIKSVELELIVQASLGYYITPLVSVLLGLMVFREQLRPAQWLAVAMAAVGVAVVVSFAGQVPWIALSLAFTFSLYGLIRKQVPVDSLVGLMVETLMLLPLALAYLGFLVHHEELKALNEWELLGKLALSGVVTAVPLLCFGQAARALPLSTLGFLQYLSPSMQLSLAMFLFGEPLPAGGEWSFPIIWLALAVFSTDSFLHYRRRRREGQKS